MAGSDSFELFETPIGELIPLDLPAHAVRRPELEKLTDNELLESVRHPRNQDFVVVNLRTGKLYDGNGRVHELRRRAADSTSRISSETVIPVEHYISDLSMFADLE